MVDGAPIFWGQYVTRSKKRHFCESGMGSCPGRNTFELAAHGLNINLSNRAPVFSESALNSITPSSLLQKNLADDEVPLLYPSDTSLKYEDSGYGPRPTEAPGSELTLNAESLLLRVDVNNIPLILAIVSRSA